MNELITVIINVYNAEKYIDRCLSSVINQTYKNLDILIINDGSTDNTLKLIKKYKDKRIRIITTKNQGLSLSRNEGIDNAEGKYLYFIDADDYIEEDTIEYLYILIKEYKTKISTCNTNVIFNNRIINKKTNNPELVSGLDLLKKVLLSQDRHGAIWNKLIDRSLFDNIRFENRIINDVVVVYKLLLKEKRIAYGNQYKYNYIKNDNSILGKKSVNHSIDLYDASLERYYNIHKKYPYMIENDISILLITVIIYGFDKKEIDEYLFKRDAFKLYKKLFSFKVILYKMRFKDKIKMYLFRISPKLYRFILNTYLKIKHLR